MPYIAYYVDLSGVAQASYELKANEDDAAKNEAREYLKLHLSIEVWDGPRWVTRLVREDRRPNVQGH
jgi:hypothetical protein